MGLLTMLSIEQVGYGIIKTSTRDRRKKEEMLWTILGVILLIWLIGLIVDVAGGLIHLLLVIALVVLIVQLLTGRRP